jgi:hypothetical protein
MAAVRDVPDVIKQEVGWRAASGFLELAFWPQKAASKLLNDVFYDALQC